MSDRGFSLIELIIAIFLSLAVLAAGYTVFFGSNRASTMQTQDSAMQDNARMAMDELCRNLRMNGYLIDFSKYPAGTAISGLTTKLTYSNHTNGPDDVTLLSASFGTKVNLHYSANKGDASIVLDDVAGITVGSVISIGQTQTTTVSALNAATKTVTLGMPLNMDYPGVYVKTGGADVLSGKTTTVVSFSSLHTFAVSFTDPAHPTLTEGGQPLAENIEDLQIRYGVDLNGDNKITWADDPLTVVGSSIDKIKMAEISIVARTAQEDPALRGTSRQVPAVADHPAWNTTDGYRRYILTRMVKLRNMSVISVL